jgi:flagellar basal body-associated protein FliL
MSQKGGIALILLIIIIALGLGLGAYFITRNTGFLPQAATDQSNQENPVPAPSVYENPFSEDVTYENPFESYENPFENI